jgi:hypothetical protein
VKWIQVPGKLKIEGYISRGRGIFGKGSSCIFT